jgi:hypothetical protein
MAASLRPRFSRQIFSTAGSIQDFIVPIGSLQTQIEAEPYSPSMTAEGKSISWQRDLSGFAEYDSGANKAVR